MDLCIGIKHSSSFASRRIQLQNLVESVYYYVPDAYIIVADDGNVTDNTHTQYTRIATPPFSGLSYGRNTLVQNCKREFVTVLDDDFIVTNATDFAGMLDIIRRGNADVVAGCFTFRNKEQKDCYAYNFTITNRQVDVIPLNPGNGIIPSHLAHNFILSRTATLRANPWDERMVMLEHEPFFLNLFRMGKKVVVMPSSTVLHDRWRDNMYEKSSSRRQYASLLQYTCKDFPYYTSYYFPYTIIDCKKRTYMGRYNMQPFRFKWNDDDASIYKPLEPTPVFLFIGILSHLNDMYRNACRRVVYMSTSRLKLDRDWSYSFFVGSDKKHTAGDVVYLKNTFDNYEMLGRKVQSMLSWIVTNIKCKYLLKTDTDTWLNYETIHQFLRVHSTPADYIGGEVSSNVHIIRRGYTEKDYKRLNVSKRIYSQWAIPSSILPNRTTYPPYVKGGGYIISTSLLHKINYYLTTYPESIMNNVEDVMVSLAALKFGCHASYIPGFIETTFAKSRILKFNPNIMLIHRFDMLGLSKRPKTTNPTLGQKFIKTVRHLLHNV